MLKNNESNKIMKTQFMLFCLLINFAVFSQDNSTKLNWLTNVEKAKKISKKDKKPILVYFNGSDWCAPCIKLKEDFFWSDEFIEKSENLVLVMIDKPRRIDIISEKQMIYNNEIIAQYNKGKKFPNIDLTTKLCFKGTSVILNATHLKLYRATTRRAEPEKLALSA